MNRERYLETRRRKQKRYSIKYPEKIQQQNRSRIVFLGKTIYLGWNPRKGFCVVCGVKGPTNMHHVEYFWIFPWFGTKELCDGCHRHKHQQEHDMLGRFM